MTAFESISMHLLWGLKDDLLETLEKSPPHTSLLWAVATLSFRYTERFAFREGCDAYRMRIASS